MWAPNGESVIAEKVCWIDDQVTLCCEFDVAHARFSMHAPHARLSQWYTVLTRSIPGGELWNYPITDVKKGEGERYVGRKTPSAQIGPQEPVFAPDGLHVYYRYRAIARILERLQVLLVHLAIYI